MSNMKPKMKQKRNQRNKKQQTYHRSINTSNLIYPKTNVTITEDYDHGQWSLSVLNTQHGYQMEMTFGFALVISSNTTITSQCQTDRMGEEMAWH